MKRYVKTLIIVMGAGTALLIAAVTGLLFYLQTDHGGQFVQNAVNQRIDGTLSWDGLEIFLFEGRVELKRLQVQDAAHHPVAGFDRLAVDISWRSLISGIVDIEALLIEGLRADLTADSRGEINLMRIFGPPTPEVSDAPDQKGGAIPVNVVIRSLKVLNASAGFEMPDKGFKATVGDVDLILTGADLKKRTGRLSLTVSDAGIISPEFNTRIRRLHTEAVLNDGRIDPFVCRLETGASAVAVDGSLQDVFGRPVADLKLESTVFLPEIQQSLRLNQILSGQVTARGTVRGIVDNPDADLALDYGGGVLGGYPVDRILLKLVLKDRIVDLNRLAVKAAGGLLTASGMADLKQVLEGGFLTTKPNPDAISYRLAVQSRDIDLGQLLPSGRRVSGIIRTDLDLTGSGISSAVRSLNASLVLAAKGLAADPAAAPVDVNLHSRFYLEGQQAGIRQLTVTSDGIDMSAGGRYDLSSDAIEANIDLTAPDLFPLLSGLNFEQPHGRLALQARLSGTVKHPVMDADLQAKQIGMQDITIGDVSLKASLDASGLLNISRFEVENQGAVASGSATVRMFQQPFALDPDLPVSLSLSLQQLDLGKFVAGKMASGVIDGHLSAKGNIRSLIATAAVTGKDVFVRPVRVGDLTAGLRFSEGRVIVDRLSVHNRRSQLEMSGFAQILEPPGIKLIEDPEFGCDIQSEGIYLEDFSDRIQGRAEIDARMEGTIKHPRGRLNLRGTDLDLAVQKLKEVTLVSEFDGEKIYFSPLRVTVAPKETIVATGWASTDKTFQVAMSSEGVSLANIDRVQQTNRAQGQVAFNIAGKGSLEDPDIRGEITASDIQIMEKSVQDITVHLEVKDQLARIQSRLNFDVTAEYHLKKRDFSALLRFDDTDLSPLFALLGMADAGGHLTGDISAAGNLDAVEQVQGSVNVDRLGLVFREKPVLQTQNLKMVLKDQRLQIFPSRWMLAADGQIDISGTGSLDGPLDVKVQGVVPMRAVGMISEDFSDASGQIRVSGGIGGTLKEPDIRMDMNMEGVGLTLPVLMQNLHDVNGRVQVTPQAIFLERIQGRLDDGRFNVSGKMDLDAFRPSSISVEVNAQSLPVRIPDTLDMTLNAALKLTGTPERSALQGQVVILDGTYYKDVNLSFLRIVEDKKRRETVPSADMTQPFLKHMALDILLKRRNPFVVDNNLAQLNILPDFKIAGTLNQPVMTGRAEVESGTIQYRKKTFTVNKGVVDFINPYRIEPQLDISSKAQIRGWAITLDISGTPDALKFKLSSVPEEQDADLLSLLLFGKTTAELIENEGGTKRPAAQMLAELIGSTFGEDIKKTTGLDIFEVDTQGQDDTDRIKVTVGKALSERMTVKYETESKSGEMLQRAIAEYKLMENILLSGFQDSKGFFGGEFKFRLEFR